jgi:hypothetical protein
MGSGKRKRHFLKHFKPNSRQDDNMDVDLTIYGKKLSQDQLIENINQEIQELDKINENSVETIEEVILQSMEVIKEETENDIEQNEVIKEETENIIPSNENIKEILEQLIEQPIEKQVEQLVELSEQHNEVVELANQEIPSMESLDTINNQDIEDEKPIMKAEEPIDDVAIKPEEKVESKGLFTRIRNFLGYYLSR